ncbi:ISRs2 transposase [Renibacterium salmoninarum ATCC 33209]|uniref:ISRs2 transposase n=1 Tax=Renibacterium salmoninarum (strain ATCC 33209 / DSM 20767 / JCM 11484 / NBRC 15589 / NCIMB 2235) TaxID=288705 RepID=A9WRB6_RENSM|nr:ISRs2 transposase [Renibacterium salmoninarum ATCC 33209]
MSTTESEQVRALKRENRELRESLEIVKAASVFFAGELDPREALIRGFIDEQRFLGWAVEVICKVLRGQGLTVTARTYRSWKVSTASVRDMAEASVMDALLGTVGTPEGMYGRRKMTAWLRRKGFEVSYRQVNRLMSLLSLKGRVRGKGVRTTVPDRNHDRAPDLLDRCFTAAGPNQRWVADFTYVRTWAGFVYVAFIIDCFSKYIVGWNISTIKDTALVSTALRMGLWQRTRTRHPVAEGLIHHSAAGSQYTSLHFGETLTLEGIAASIGSVGDAYDNALAESTIGLFKTEAVREDSPFRNGPLKTIDEVGWASLAWIDWYNNDRLHTSIGDIPPTEHEVVYYAKETIPAQPVQGLA